MNGANFGQGMLSGLVSGGIGALGGGLIGGIQGGYQFNKLQRAFTRLDDGTIATTTDGKLTPSNETLNEFSDKFFKDFKYAGKVRNIYDEEMVKSTVGDGYDAFTRNKLIDGKYNIYYSKSAFASKLKLFMVMGHEYVHVAHFVNISSFNRNFSEYAANKWESIITSYNRNYSQIRLDQGMNYLRNEGIFSITPQIYLKLRPYEQLHCGVSQCLCHIFKNKSYEALKHNANFHIRFNNFSFL